MQLKLYKFSKRKNSTKRPADTDVVATKNIVTKRETSVINPTFLVNNVDLTVNYCAWADKYYFVNDIVLNDDGMYELRCSIDALATAKTEILSTTAQVMYSSNSSKNIMDKRIPITADPMTVSGSSIADFTKFTIAPNSLGTIILGVTGKGSFGAYMLANNYDLPELLDGVDSWWEGLMSAPLPPGLNILSFMFSTTGKQLMHGGSAAECLKSAIALPILIDPEIRATYPYEDLTLGSYPCRDASNLPIQVFYIDKPILTETLEVNIPWRYNDWRDCAPYTIIYLYLPFVGLITLPSSDLIGNTTLLVQYSINLTSGDISIEVKGGQIKRPFATSSANIAMNTAYGSTGIDTNKLTNAAVAGAGALIGGAVTLASGGAAAPAMLGIAGGLATAAGGTIDALGGSGFGSGGLGGGASQALTRQVICFAVTRTLTDEPENLKSLIGKPYFGKATISSMSGYVQTEGFSLAGNYLDSIRDAVNSMMDRGVYLE